MPFYINRDWPTPDGHDGANTNERALGWGHTRGKERQVRDVSTSALLAWQRQEIYRLKQENQRLQDEMERRSFAES